MDVKSAARVVDLIEAFADERRVLSVSDLARLVSMPISSCHGILRTLEEKGWLYEPRPRGGYYVTRRLLEVAQVVAAHDPLLERVEPLARALRDRTGETVVFGRLQGERVLYLLVVESSHSVRYSAKAGEWRTVYANSIGKAILGVMGSTERAKIFSRLRFKQYTSATVRSARQLEIDLNRSAMKGWYANIGESVPEVMAVAMPVTLGGGIYALSVGGPMQRMKPATRRIVASLRETLTALNKTFSASTDSVYRNGRHSTIGSKRSSSRSRGEN